MYSFDGTTIKQMSFLKSGYGLTVKGSARGDKKGISLPQKGVGNNDL